MNARHCLLAAAILGFLGVAAGAFGAHALADKLSPERLAIFETAARYQLFHALALLALGLRSWESVWLRRAGWAFVSGVVVFSGSLYLLVLLDLPKLGAMTPLGGLGLLLGWLFLLLAARRSA